MVRVTVPIPGRAYDVVIGTGVIGDGRAAPARAAEGDDARSWWPTATWPRRGSTALAAASARRGLAAVLLTVPPGEDAKTLQVYGTLLHQLATQEAHRDDVVVALGGGVDRRPRRVRRVDLHAGGAVRAGARRRCTAQVDAAIGGKTAVNLPEGKNLVGTFAQPRAVLADVERARVAAPSATSGRGSPRWRSTPSRSTSSCSRSSESDPAPVLARDPAALEALVARCVRGKARTVAEDERDTGARLILNYGHTLGHALERLDAFAGRTHGEAIAVGMVFAARLAERRGIAPAGPDGAHDRAC